MHRNLKLVTLLGVGAAALGCLVLGVVWAQWMVALGGMAAVLCLVGFAAPFPIRASASVLDPPEEQSIASRPDVTAEQITQSVTSGGSEGRDLVDDMISQGRCALLLRPEIANHLSPEQYQRAQEALDGAMAVVPAGPVLLRSARYDEMSDEDRRRAEKRVEVDGYYLDRYPVTNCEFQKFVAAGGYEEMALWDEIVWPAILQFVDTTGQSGPRFWKNGRYPAGKEDHPVVGVTWFEACAYARWVGKRLASDAEWVKAAAWPVTADNSRLIQRKFPWGEAMDRTLANLWGSGPGDTVPVSRNPEGASVAGILHLVGNVWEWTASNFGAWEPAALRLETEMPLRSIRGGAFDTYFESQAQCQFQSGDSPLARKHNIGFRCALGFCDVAHHEVTAQEESPDEHEIREPALVSSDASQLPEEVLS